jgi:DNA polymerase III epsilon subunit-like protein
MYKRICFIYTETNGLHHTNRDVIKKELYNYARMVSLNYIIGYVKNDEFVEEMKVRTIVRPRSMYIPKETEQFHGITQEYALANGTDPDVIIKKLKNDIKDVNIIVSHNVDFHLRTILSEAVRYNIVLDFSPYIIIDTINFYHMDNYIKLKDLVTKLKLKTSSDDTVENIKNVFFKLYKKFEKSLNKEVEV